MYAISVTLYRIIFIKYFVKFIIFFKSIGQSETKTDLTIGKSHTINWGLTNGTRKGKKGILKIPTEKIRVSHAKIQRPEAEASGPGPWGVRATGEGLARDWC